MPLGPQFSGHLFDSVFQRARGITLDEGIEGWEGPHHIVSQHFGVDKASPEMIDEWHELLRSNNLAAGRKAPTNWREHTAEILETHRKKDPIENVVHDWMMDHTAMLVGSNTAAVADRLVRLSDTIKGGGVTPNPVYRGAALPPQEEVSKNPDFPLSFTEDPYVARSFAAEGYRGKRGKTFKLGAGTARGIFVPDFVSRERTVGSGRRPEREWLIDPSSISPDQ